MEDKIENWNPTCKRFVAFLDIMGFRDRVFRENHNDIKKMLEALRPTIENIEVAAKEWLKTKPIKENQDLTQILPFVFPISFSDSIILISSNDSVFSAIAILSDVERILSAAINTEIPMKGAIAYGEMTADLDKSIYFGAPLIDAYDLQNEIQLYGVVFHHTFEQYLKRKKMIGIPNGLDVLINYNLPMKSGKINHYVIDWTYTLEKNKEPLELVSKLYDNVSGKPRIYVDNTLEFVRWAIKNRIELKQKKTKEKPA